MKVEFDVKYGKNIINIPLPERAFQTFTDGSTNLYADKVTIYNDVPSDGVSPRRFERFVIDKCLIVNGVAEGADGTIQKIVNTQSVYTKDIARYKSPIEYRRLPADVRVGYYTVAIDDFVVFGEVDDVVTSGREYQELQEKYRDNGFLVTAVNPSIHGMAVDHVQITHA